MSDDCQFGKQERAQFPCPIFMGQELPPLRAGKVWAMRIYPGGRRVVVQEEAQNIDYTEDAVAELKAGRRVLVWLDDAIDVLQRANLPKVSA